MPADMAFVGCRVHLLRSTTLCLRMKKTALCVPPVSHFSATRRRAVRDCVGNLEGGAYPLAPWPQGCPDMVHVHFFLCRWDGTTGFLHHSLLDNGQGCR